MDEIQKHGEEEDQYKTGTFQRENPRKGAARFLREFELEQQEEEDLWNYNLDRAKLADGDKAATLILDHEMAQREANGNKKYKCMKQKTNI